MNEMVDDGRDHGDDRMEGDREGSRHYEQRRETSHWKPTSGFFARSAAGVAGLVFVVVFLMNALNWRLTGSSADIKANTAEISDLKLATATNTTAIATLTAAMASAVAASTSQGRDIAELKATLASLVFINCGIYQKIYAEAPTISECVKRQSTP